MFEQFISGRQMGVLREGKAYALGLRTLLNRRFRPSTYRSPSPDGEGCPVALLSLGGRLGSPFLAKVLAESGREVHVFAKRMPGHELKWAVKWHYVDVMGDPDVLREAVAAIRPVGVFSESRNVLLPVKNRLLTELGLRTLGDLATRTSNSKRLFRETLDAAGLPNLPWSPLADVDALARLDFPMVLKPDMGTGSRGISFVENRAERDEAACRWDETPATATTGGDLIAEQYVEGRQFDVEGVSRDGQPCPLSLTEECYERRGRLFPSLWYLFSPPIEAGLERRLLERAGEIVTASGVKNGAWHCEMRVNAEGEILAIDYSNRMGYPVMVSEASGVSFLGAYVSSLSDESFVPPEPSRHTVYQRFLRDEEERRTYLRLADENPDAIIEFRRASMQVANVTRFGRISIRAENVTALHELLERYDLVPAEWAKLYSLPDVRR